MRTGEAVLTLRAEGFDLTPGYLDFLIREQHFLPPLQVTAGYAWELPDLERLRSVLRRRNRGPAVDRCTACGRMLTQGGISGMKADRSPLCETCAVELDLERGTGGSR